MDAETARYLLEGKEFMLFLRACEVSVHSDCMLRQGARTAYLHILNLKNGDIEEAGGN